MRMFRRSTLVLLLVLAGLVPVAVSLAASSKPGLTVSAAPTARTAVQGTAATYTITVGSINGFNGTVTLSTQGAPAGAISSFSPATLALSPSMPSMTSTLTITTSSSTPIATSSITVKAASGGTSATTSVSLTVAKFSLSATPSTISVPPGDTASYSITVTRASGFTNSISFTASGMPAGTTGAFTPPSTTGGTSSLQLVTSLSTPSGNFAITISGGSQGSPATVQLSVNSSTGGGKSPFTISGNLSSPLAPGVSRPLDLTLTNPNNQDLNVTNLTVTVQSVTRSDYAIGHSQPCTTGDYAVSQYSGSYPIVVAAGGTVSLSGKSIPSTAWPKVSMLNTTTNQDGCKSATITLSYVGAGSGG